MKTPEERRRLRRKNVALALLLGGLIAVFYAVSMARMGGW